MDVTNGQVAAISGWFPRIDVAAFRILLQATADCLNGGDLAELGAYQGKSAVLIGAYLNEGETFTVVDLFGRSAGDAANVRENADSYPDLTRVQFETAYRSVHGNLPVIIQDFSSVITQHASHGTHRFVHVDASHLYEHVVKDIEAAQLLLKPDGIVVLDDYRSEHTPGVAAAVWQAAGNGLHPFLLTPKKMYATWGDVTPWKRAVDAWVGSFRDCHERQVVGADEVIRVWNSKPWVARYVPPVTMPGLARIRARIGK